MKLVYCWIKNYLNIQNQDFNFGSQWIYSAKEESDKALTIYRSKNDKYVKNFFKLADNGFENVTAIVGENGAGKTNFLDYLGELIITENSPNYLWSDGSLPTEPKGAILIFEDESGNIFVKKNGNAVNAEFKTKDFTTQNHVISYSPIYDFRNINIGDKTHFLDVSSNYFISKDTQDRRSLIEDNFLGIEFHKTSEVRRQLSFLNNATISKDISGKLFIPEKITITIRDTNIPLPVENLRNILGLHKVIEKAFDIIVKERILLVKSFSHLKNKIQYFDFLKNLFCTIILNTDNEFLDEEFNKALNIINTITFDEYFVYNDLELELVSNPKKDLQFESFFKIFLENQTYFHKENILKFMDDIKTCVNEFSQGDIIIPKDGALLLLNSYENLLKDYTKEANHPMTIGFLDFNWKGMSSGEISFLNLFSRLHYAHKELERFENEDTEKNKYPSNIYLLIDEGEQGFHFQWQKEYLKTLIQFVPQIFKTGTKIHLIFATHSPITLSDMPNHHIVFLKKDNNNKVKVLTNNERVKQTFAANIHEILYDSFFMDKGFIGAFAVEKINAVFKYLNDELLKKNKQKSEYRLKKDKKHQSYKAIISNIDEPLIRVKLEEKMAELEESEDPRQREIDSLEAQQKRIEERLKNLKDKDNDTNTTQS